MNQGNMNAKHLQQMSLPSLLNDALAPPEITYFCFCSSKLQGKIELFQLTAL